MGLMVFLDFGGVVTDGDAEEKFFRTFGGAECDDILSRHRAGAISAKESLRAMTATIGTLPEEEVKAVARARPLRAGLHALASFCREKSIPLRILSDGFDLTAREVLDARGLGNIPFTANVLRTEGTGPDGMPAVEILFPFDDAECDRCGCCKRNLAVTGAGEGDIIVYVGESFSDLCPARYADVVFARGALQAACQEENISYYVYESLFDVRDRLADLATAPRLRARRMAALLRKALFEREP